MVLIQRTIEIAAPPAEVRRILLDFPSYPSWVLTSFPKSITPIDKSKSGEELQKGDKVTAVLSAGTFTPTVIENSTRRFAWRGGLWPIAVGEHSFQCEDSTMTPGGTRFVHGEEFSGLLASVMRLPFGPAKRIGGVFENFNGELKARVEGGGGDGGTSK